MALGKGQTVGTTPKNDYRGTDSSPDIAPDGSLVAGARADDSDTERSKPLWRRLIPFL